MSEIERNDVAVGANATRLIVGEGSAVERYENNLVTLRIGDDVYEALEPRRLFPVSRADIYITLLDSEGIERAVIPDPEKLDPVSRKIIRESLDDYYLVPRITAILSIEEKYGTLHLNVDTDRGVKSFDIRDRNHDIKAYGDGRVRVRDSDDNRYIIDDWRSLDKASRRRLLPLI